MQTESKIKESEEKFRIITENSADAIFITNKQGKYVYVNKAAADLLDYTTDDLMSMNIINLSTSDEIEKNIEDFKNVVNKGHLFTEISLKNAGGTFIPVELNAVLLPNGLIYGSCRDITERKIADQKLIEAKEKAEKANELKTNFLEQMSHEIRTPIHVLLSYANLIQDEVKDTIDPELLEGFAGINLAGKRIIRTVDLILNVSELQTGAYEPFIREIDLKNDILDKIYLEHKSIANSRGLIFTLDFKTTNNFILADEYSAMQIFTNLIDNAIKYTKEGRVEILVERDKTNKLIVTISDTGIGIAKDYLPLLFEPFSQEEQGRTRSYEGNGLGLTLVKRYCEFNNAEIFVESEKNVGSTFKIVFNNMGESK